VTTRFFVEIHRRGGHVPLIQYVDTEANAKRLFASAAEPWTLRRYGQDGRVIKEERR
jgi:hypothetical protein